MTNTRVQIISARFVYSKQIKATNDSFLVKQAESHIIIGALIRALLLLLFLLLLRGRGGSTSRRCSRGGGCAAARGHAGELGLPLGYQLVDVLAGQLAHNLVQGALLGIHADRAEDLLDVSS